MSRENRFDRLESDIVDALRRAPGATPSADLDARILARAHAAVAKPKRRPQPIWFSMAAGLVVLVGSGLALRIWQQLEHAPSALDLPAAKVAAPAKSVADPQPATAGPATAAIAESMPDTAQARRQEPAAAAQARKLLAPAVVAPAPSMPVPEQQVLGLERDQFAGAESKLEGASGLAAPPEVADVALDAPEPAPPQPFPAESEPVAASAPTPSAMTPQVPARVAQPKPAPPPAVIATTPAAAPAAQAAAVAAEEVVAPPAAPPAPADDLGVIDMAQPRSQPGADVARATGIAVTGAVSASSEALAKRDRAEQAEQSAPTASEDGRADVFATGLAAVRDAIAVGDQARARRLLAELRRQFPQRELPEDLRHWADQAQ